jgi:hypothetical protein
VGRVKTVCLKGNGRVPLLYKVFFQSKTTRGHQSHFAVHLIIINIRDVANARRECTYIGHYNWSPPTASPWVASKHRVTNKQLELAPACTWRASAAFNHA